MFKKTVFRVRCLLSMFEMCVEVVHSSRKCSLGPAGGGWVHRGVEYSAVISQAEMSTQHLLPVGSLCPLQKEVPLPSLRAELACGDKHS